MTDENSCDSFEQMLESPGSVQWWGEMEAQTTFPMLCTESGR